MRRLIVKRKKQFVAAAVKVRIGIKTNDKGDVRLRHTNLKILGTIKNGKSLVVNIPNDETEIYVLYDRVTPQNFHAKCTLPEGRHEETLYTFSRFNPFKGNPFLISPYEDMSREEKQKLIKADASGKSKGFQALYYVMMIAFAIIGFILGFTLMS